MSTLTVHEATRINPSAGVRSRTGAYESPVLPGPGMPPPSAAPVLREIAPDGPPLARGNERHPDIGRDVWYWQAVGETSSAIRPVPGKLLRHKGGTTWDLTVFSNRDQRSYPVKTFSATPRLGCWTWPGVGAVEEEAAAEESEKPAAKPRARAPKAAAAEPATAAELLAA